MVGAFIKEKAPVEASSVNCEISEGSLTTLANTEAVNCELCVLFVPPWSLVWSAQCAY